MTTIKAKRLTLAPITEEGEIAMLVKWMNTPEIVRYSEHRRSAHTAETERAYIEAHIDAPYLGIYVAEQLIGSMSSHNDKPNSVSHVGIMIGNKNYWGNGFGREAWAAYCDHQFKEGYRRIEAGCMSANEPMIRVCRAYGMTPEGRKVRYFDMGNGSYCDLMQFAKFNV